MDIFKTRPGDSVRFLPNGGRESEHRLAETMLIIGEVYTVKRLKVYGWSSDVILKEFPGKEFNTCMFENVEPEYSI